MNKTYYMIVRLVRTKISEKFSRVKVIKTQYEVSKTWAFKHFEEEKVLMTPSETKNQTLELWLVEETPNGTRHSVVKSWQSPWYELAS